MTNRIPRYDTNDDGSIDKLDLAAKEDAVWSHLDTINKSDAPFDRSQITTVTNVAAGANAATTVGNVASGEILVFPSGTFTWDSEQLVNQTDWGVICQDDTFFEVPAGFGVDPTDYPYTLDTGGASNNVLLENLTWTTPNATDTAAPGVRFQMTEQGYVNGFECDTNGPSSKGDHETNAIEPLSKDYGGHVRVDDLVAHDYADIGMYDSTGRAGTFIGPSNEGPVTFVRPILTGFRNNGMYVGRTGNSGRVIVQDGLLGNNNVSCVRVGHKVEVYNTTLFVDIGQYLADGGTNTNSTHNTRGIWFETNQNSDPSGGLVEGCSFIWEDVTFSRGCLVSSDNQWATARDCQFLINAGTDTMHAVVNTREAQAHINVFDSTFDGSAARDLDTGTGEIDGAGNYYNPTLTANGDLPVVDNSGYEFDWSRTHPDYGKRPAGTGETVSPDTVTFRNRLRTEDDGAGTVTVDVVEDPYRDVINRGVVTAVGGNSPAFDGTVSVGARQDDPFLLIVRPHDPNGWAGDYAFTYDWGHSWDDTAGNMDASLTVTWESNGDPGAGNDLPVEWEARRL